jgi:hypothetical protein
MALTDLGRAYVDARSRAIELFQVKSYLRGTAGRERRRPSFDLLLSGTASAPWPRG